MCTTLYGNEVIKAFSRNTMAVTVQSFDYSNVFKSRLDLKRDFPNPKFYRICMNEYITKRVKRNANATFLQDKIVLELIPS